MPLAVNKRREVPNKLSDAASVFERQGLGVAAAGRGADIACDLISTGQAAISKECSNTGAAVVGIEDVQITAETIAACDLFIGANPCGDIQSAALAAAKRGLNDGDPVQLVKDPGDV